MTSEMLKAEIYLSVVNDRGKRHLPLRRVYRNMRRPGLFIKAYENLYGNDGALTQGTDPEDTIQGMSLNDIDAIIKQLKEGDFQWKPTRRAYAPKSHGGKRPLAVPNWSEKLVQEVLRMVLEAYYEPRFRGCSHGFRPNRGCHTALKTIKGKWTGVKWFIEGDIKSCFDSFYHRTLIDILKRDIHDERLMKLIREMLEAGYMEDWVFHKTYSGVPQGGVISPLLSNIYLNELDRFIEDELMPIYNQGKERARNREYTRVRHQVVKAREAGDKEQEKSLRQQLRQIPTTDHNDPTFRRLKYCRYADDWLIGYIGTKAEAEEIKRKVQEFLQTIKLELSNQKTVITHAGSGRARFLGYEIYVARDNNKINKRKGHKVRTLNGKIMLSIPHDVIQKWVREYSRNGKPRHIGALAYLSDFELVKTFGARLRGVINYYKLAYNLYMFSKARFVVMESLRKTLMHKHKMSSTRESYRKYYVPRRTKNELRHMAVSVEREDKAPLTVRCGETNLRTNPKGMLRDEIPPYVFGGWNELSRRLMASQCELCGCKGRTQGHHIRRLKDIRQRYGSKELPSWAEFMLARNRKTVFVCFQCHQDITHGRYDGKRVR